MKTIELHQPCKRPDIAWTKLPNTIQTTSRFDRGLAEVREERRKKTEEGREKREQRREKREERRKREETYTTIAEYSAAQYSQWIVVSTNC